MMVDRVQIESLLPHGPGMVLIDCVLACDAGSIRCRVTDHSDPNNPLRRSRGVPSAAGIEYGAQAAALHGALNGFRKAGAGAVLGGVRDVRVFSPFLDCAAKFLFVGATLLFSQDSGAVYSFEVGPDTGNALVEGRFTVMYR